MNNLRRMLMASASGYAPRAVVFDGTNDYLSKSGAYTSADADKKTGIISVWVKTVDYLNRRLIGSSGTGSDYIFLNLTTSGQVSFNLFNSPSPILIQLVSIGGVITNGNWHHILISWDAVGARADMYVDGVDVTLARTVNNTSPALPTITTSYLFVSNNSFPNNKFYGDVASFYINDSEYLDITIEANRRKFVTGAGSPVFLGLDGSLPTGNDPILYLNLDDGDAVSTFANNKGYGGGMTLTGALTEAPTKPSL